ncbi:MAG: hypothetical protein PHF51_04315 [Candidatus ainarchaeum sp.]|nr:hypothetical protein [Candidatus ainarchaeum sp.]
MGILGSLMGRGSRGSAAEDAKAEEMRRLHKKIERIEEMLDVMSAKTDDRFEVILRGIDSVAPHQKGHFISSLEEKLFKIKRDMIGEAVVAECVRDTKSYAELRKGVRARTGLVVSSAFLDSCVKRMEYEGKVTRVGSRFSTPELLRSGHPHHSIPHLDERRSFEAATIAAEGGVGLGTVAAADVVLKVVNELEAAAGPVPLEAVVTESEKRGIGRDNAKQIIDEHLMVTGSLYEPKQGFVKLVKPMTV